MNPSPQYPPYEFSHRSVAAAAVVLCGVVFAAALALLVLPLALCFAAVTALTGDVESGTLDADGITWKPWLRRVRRLKWGDVETVQWLRGRAWLQGSGTEITLRWELFRGGAGRDAKEYTRAALSPAFFLVDPPGPRPPTRAEARRSGLEGGLLLAVTLGLCLFSFFKLTQDFERNEAWMWGIWASMFGPFLLVPLIAARDRRRLAIYHRRAPNPQANINVPS